MLDIPQKNDCAASRFDFLASGGQMAKTILAKDWSQTPLGPIGSWPQSLRTTVSLCLASNFAISIAWGRDRVQIYNDGYWKICGAKHPRSMGQDLGNAGFLPGPKSARRLSVHKPARLRSAVCEKA
jgi:hypothetical protein